MMKRPRLTRPFYLTLLAILGLLLVSYFPLTRIRAANAGATILPSPSAGKPLVNLKNPQNLKITYTGPSDAVAALQAGTANPTALAAADFNADGAMDVVAGYSTKNGGAIVLMLGNPDAYAPTDLSLYKKAMQGSVPATFLSKASVFAVQESPDLMVTGDFNRDGYKDVLIAAHGGGLYLLAGDGHGNLLAPQAVPLPGQVTALAVTPDAHVAVSTDGPNGPQLAMLAPGAEGLTAGAIYPLPARGDAMAWGSLGGGADLAVGAGANVVMFYNALATNPQTETVTVPFQVKGLVLGDFIWDRDGRTEISVLADDGSIHILQHGTLNTTPVTAAELPARRAAIRGHHAKPTAPPNPTALGAWTIAKQIPYTGSAPSGPVSASAFNSPRLANSSTPDLMVLDAGRNQLNILDTSGKTESPSAGISFTSTPVAALALPQKINAGRDIVVLAAGQAAPMVISPNFDPTCPVGTCFNVTTNADEDDVLACVSPFNASGPGPDGVLSLREAVCEANNQAANPSTVNVPSGTYSLSLHTGGETGELQQGTGTAYNLTINGTGTAADTIIQQTDGVDRILEEDYALVGNNPVTIQNVTMTGGNCSNLSPGDCGDGGGAIIAGAIAGDDLTLTNVVMSNNGANPTATTMNQANGGAIGFETPADLTVTSSTFSNNTASGAGGAIDFMSGDSGGNISITNSTFTNNTNIISGGAASIQIYGGFTGSITGSTFTGNKTTESAGDGGAIEAETEFTADGDGTFTMSNSRIVGNSAPQGATGVYLVFVTPTINNNWWGCNAGPNNSGCDTILQDVSGTNEPFIPATWLVLGVSANPTQIPSGGTSTLTADLTHNSSGTGGFSVPNGTPVTFGGTLDSSVNPTSTTLTSGQATSTYTAGSTAGNGTGTATVDNAAVSTPVQILDSVTVTTSPANLSITVDGTTYTAPQTFNWVVGTSQSLNTTSPQSGSPGTQYVWSTWSQGGTQSQTVTAPTAATTYTANFTTQYQLTMQASPSADGSVTPTSGSYYPDGTLIAVTASANAGYQFDNWTTSNGGTFDSATSPSTTFHMPSAATTVTGNFSAVVTPTSISVTNVTPSSEVYGLDSQVTITAVLSWTGSGPAPTASDVTIGGNGPSGYSATSCGAPSGDTLTCTASYTPTAADTVGSYTESASFSGDSNYTSSSSSGTNNFSITQASSTTSVTSGQNPSLVGQQVTFTATIDGEYGEVKGRNGAVLGGSVSVIKRGAPQRGLTQKGQAHPLTAGGITGTVTWSANTGCSPTSVSGDPGTSQCITSTLPQGTDTITATYSGDSNHSGSMGTLSGGQVVNPAVTPTSIGVTNVSPASEAYGEDSQVTITAVLSWTGSGPAPTASDVTISGNGPSGYSATSCGAPSGDTLTCTASYTPTAADTVGSYTESATFSGDSNYTGSNSTQTNNFSITQASSTTSVTSGQNPSLVGQQVTFTATIDGEYGEVKGRNGAVLGGGVTKRSLQGLTQKRQAHPLVPAGGITGTVTWSANTGCSPTPVSGNPGTSQCTTSTLPQGTDTITGTYSGDSNHSGSMGTLSGGQIVNPSGPQIMLNPTSIDFGDVYLLNTQSTGVTVSNTGTSTVTISSVSLTLGAGTSRSVFKFVNSCPKMLTAGNNCVITINFDATVVGSLSATLNVADNASGSPQQVGLSATVIDPKARLSSSSLNFSTIRVGQSHTKNVTLTNPGKTTLDISSIGITGADQGDFAQSNNCPSTLTAGASCAISVTFTPTTTGARSATLTVVDNAQVNEQTATLSGKGD
jgi:hypothetical protein